MTEVQTEPGPGVPPASSGAEPGSGPQGGQPEGSKWWTLVAVCMGTFMLLLDVTIVNVALPAIQHALHSSFSDLQWVVDAYALSLASLLLTAGSLADMYGRRLLYVIGVVVFTASSLTCGLASSTLMLQVSRAVQGIGGAIMFSVSLALLAGAFRGKERGVAFGIWGGITGLAVAIGPLMGGILTSGISWNWIFFVNVPIGIVAVIITVTQVAEARQPNPRRPDWTGFLLFSLGLCSLVYALIESSVTSFSNGRVIFCFVAAAVLLVAFVVVEAKGKQPMFDLALFRKPTFTGGAVAAFGMSASIFAMLLYLVLYLQDVLGFSALGTGLRLIVISGGIIVTSAVSGRLTSKVPVRFLIGPGLLLIGVGLLLERGLTATSSWEHLIAGFIVGGLGIGMVNPPLASTAVGVVTPDRAGMASGINSTFRQVGIATGIALLGTLFSSAIKSDVASKLAHTSLASRAATISNAVEGGDIGRVMAHFSASQRHLVGYVTKASFTDGLDKILLVGAIIALVSAVITFATIRSKDFAHHRASAPAAAH